MKRLGFTAAILAFILVFGCVPVLSEGPKPSPPSKGGAIASYALGMPPISLDTRTKIDPALLKELLQAQQAAQALGAKRAAPLTFLVYLKDRAPLAQVSQMSSGKERRELLVHHLQATAKDSQAGVVSYLEQKVQEGAVTRYKSYWVFNGLAVDGDLATALALARRPDVEAIRPNRMHHLPPHTVAGASPASPPQPEWNITKIGADRVWNELGITGEGIVVANMDSGVDWTHPALQAKYRGYDPDPAAVSHDYNWFDPTGTYPDAPGPNIPYISGASDHGTHTMGTIVGSEVTGSHAIGVAPGARWIAAKVFDNDGNSYDEWIHAGFQWCLAPTDLNGENPDPSKAPHIVSNSWGDDNGADETFRQDLAAWRAAGIFSTWASGNAGPDPHTVGSPASFDIAFAVGATDSQDGIASFSSRGPSLWGEIKPEVVAPGVNIRSSIPGGGYQGGWNGTSMATPHAAGLAALMWEAADQSLSIPSTVYIITSTVVDLGTAGEDDTYGYGRIDAFQAVGAIAQGGTFAGQVTDEGSGAPIAGASVAMHNLETGGQTSTLTGSDGTYSFSVAEGLYDVVCSKFGYDDETAYSIEIRAQILTQLDFTLSLQATGVIEGRVTRASDGQPVPATVTLVGMPLSVDVDGDGYYTLTVPVGTYTVRAMPKQVGHRGAQVSDVLIAPEGVVALDFQLFSSPRLLLVDGDAWLASGHMVYYEQALDALLFKYDSRSLNALPTDIPSASELAGYDIVIWVHPITSPGYIGAWSRLGAYLDQGGRLFISGQDIGYWDAQYAHTEYLRYLHALYVRDNAGLEPFAGLPGEAFEGIQLTYNTEDSAKNQSEPDSIASGDALARSIFGYPSGVVTGLLTDACAYRTLYLGFGLEGVGPTSARQQVIAIGLDQLVTEGPEARVRIAISPSHQSALAGDTVTYDVSIINEGQHTDSYVVSLDSPHWEARLVDTITLQPVTEVVDLPPCGMVHLWLEVTVPESAILNEAESTDIQAFSLTTSGFATGVVETVAVRPWAIEAELPEARFRVGCAANGCEVYVIGGYDRYGDASGAVDMLDLATNSWSAGASKPTPAANSAIAQLDGLFYVIGGYNADAGGFLDAVDVYDPATDAWIQAAPLPAQRSSMAAAACGGLIYAFGGNGPGGDFATGYAFDPVAGIWSEVAPVPFDYVTSARAVSINGYIYLAGGRPSRSQLFRYDPISDSWLMLNAMNSGCHSFAMITDGQHLYVAGGENEGGESILPARYDPASDSWLDLPHLQLEERSGAAGAYADGRFYIMGGSEESIAKTIEGFSIDLSLNGSSFGVDSVVAKPGDTIGYTLLLSNPAHEAVLASWSHVLPEDLEYVAGSGTGGAMYEEGTREWTWAGELAGGETRTFGFSAQVGDDIPIETTLTSTVFLDAEGCRPRELATSALISLPSLEASTKVVDGSPVGPGDELRYVIRVANDSPFTIANASLVDSIPDDTTYVAGSVSGATFNAAENRIEWAGTLSPRRQIGGDFEWIDATQGTVLTLADDSCVGSLPLGFDFHFYGNRYSEVYVNSNGMVLFEQCSSSYSNSAIPDPQAPNNFIAAFWDDLRPGWAGGKVYFATFGVAPDRYAVIEWHGVHFYDQQEPQTFEVVLYESSNAVVCQYLQSVGERGRGSSATIGIENADGTGGVQYLHNGVPSGHKLSNRTAIELVHSSTCTAFVHGISFDVRVDAMVPPLTVIANTAWIDDGLSVHERTAISMVESPVFIESSKAVQPARALSGDTLAYTLHLVNSGDVDSTATMLLDPLPTGLTYVTGSLVGEGAVYNNDLRRIEWQGSVPHGPTGVEIAYQARVGDGIGVNSWITNTATVSERGVDVATLEAGLLVNDVDLSCSSKVADHEELMAGSDVAYTITLCNEGLYLAEQVTMSDSLSTELQLVAGSLEGGTYDGGTRTISWQGSLAADAEHVITFLATVLPETPNGTRLSNTAVIDDGLGTVIERTVSLTVLRADLSESSMSANSTWVAPGEMVTYTIKLVNAGKVVTGATLSCTLPPLLSLVEGTSYASAGDLLVEGQTLIWSGELSAKGMVIVRYVAMVSPDVSPAERIVTEAYLVDSGGTAYELDATIVVAPSHVFFWPLMFGFSQMGLWGQRAKPHR